jgi:hypothetical protein
MADLSKTEVTHGAMVDMGNVPDVFCNAIAQVDKIGSCFRFTFVVPELSCNDAISQIIVAKLVIPAEALEEIVCTMATPREVLGRTCAAAGIETRN